MSDDAAMDAVLNTQVDEVLGVKISVEEIREKIKALSGVPAESMKSAMHDLKKALLANPEACNLMHPEEIGLMVAGLYKSTGQKILEEKVKNVEKNAKKIAKGVDLSKVDLNKLDDF